MKRSQDEVKVGAFVLIGLILFSMLVFFISGVYLFRPGYIISVKYDYVSILDKGAPVRMAGVRVGEVSKVDLVYDEALKKLRVQVKLFVDKAFRVQSNYKFEIRGTHVLSEPHVEISPVTGEAPLLKGGEVLEGEPLMPIEALIERAQHIAKDLQEIVGSFHNAVATEEASNNLKMMMANMAQISESLKTVLSGNEQDLKKSIDNVEAATASLEKIMQTIESGEGTAGNLLMKDELYKDMKAFMSDIKRHPWKLLKKDKKFLFF